MKTRSSRQNNSSSSPSHQTNAKWEALEPIAPLKTKLCVPPFRAGWISRLRLDKRMEAGFSRKFTLISAPAGFLKAFKGDNRYIADYFTEEVLNRQPEHLRNFLLQTSILGRLCGPLCDAVTRQDNGRQVLSTMEKANLFVIPLDEERSWYRYHRLFANLLEQRLRAQQGELVAELHGRASRWLTKHGFKNDALDHAFAAQDYSRIVQLLEEIAEIDWDRARESRLLGWFKKLPDEHLDANPRLCIFYAREMFKSGYMDEAEHRLLAAERILDSAAVSELDPAGLRGRIAVMRAYMSTRTGDLSRSVAFSSQALKLLPPKDLNWRSVAATILGMSYGSDNLVEQQQAFVEAMKISKAAGNVYYHLFAVFFWLAAGDLTAAVNWAHECGLNVDDEISNLHQLEYLSLTHILIAQNKLQDADRLLQRLIEAAKAADHVYMMIEMRLCRSMLLTLKRDMAKFGALYQKNGNWNGSQVIASEWIDESTMAYSTMDETTGVGYGYLWKTIPADSQMGQRIGYAGYYHTGAGGQVLIIIPDLKLVIVERYDAQRDWDEPGAAGFTRINLIQTKGMFSLVEGFKS